MADTPQHIIHNCHTHVFTIDHVPDTVHPAIPYLRNPNVVRFARIFLQTFHRLADFYLSFGSPAQIGLFLRLLSFLDLSQSIHQGQKITQQEVFLRLRGAYPTKTPNKFVCLPLDMDYITDAYIPAPENYLIQLEELRNLRDTYPEEVIPFVCADPRRPGFFDLVREYVEVHKFQGIKIYPPLGFFPFDPRLDDLYGWAQAKNIPILSHCTPGGIYKRSLPINRNHPKTGKLLPGNTPSAFAQNYTHPSNYDDVLKQFPKLKLCLAHFGGNIHWNKFMNESSFPTPEDLSWTAIIIKQMRSYENVYADISYTAYERNLLPLLGVLIATPDLGSKILFGTDYFVVQADSAEREFGIRLRGTIGEEAYWKIAEENPRKFLP